MIGPMQKGSPMGSLVWPSFIRLLLICIFIGIVFACLLVRAGSNFISKLRVVRLLIPFFILRHANHLHSPYYELRMLLLCMRNEVPRRLFDAFRLYSYARSGKVRALRKLLITGWRLADERAQLLFSAVDPGFDGA
jgi:hypothetical protein